jgi:hypothetical protein
MTLDDRILKAEETLSNDILKVREQFYSQLILILQEFSTKNKLDYTDNQLAKLKTAIDKAFNKTSYEKYVNNYLSLYDEVIKDNIDFYKANKILTENYIINNEYLTELRRQAVDGLLSADAIREQFKKPIENLMRIDIIRGISYQEAAEKLQGKLGDMEGRVKTIVKDSLLQYDGAIGNEVRKEFNLKKFIYRNALVEASRPFCIHMKKQKVWTIEELQEVLDEYCPDGIPSESKIEITTISGDRKKMSKGSGMIKGTNVVNFGQYRGGYGCGHLVGWIK